MKVVEKVDIMQMLRAPSRDFRFWLRQELGRLYEMEEGQRRLALEEMMVSIDALPRPERHRLHRLVARAIALMPGEKSQTLGRSLLWVVQSRQGAEAAVAREFFGHTVY